MKYEMARTKRSHVDPQGWLCQRGTPAALNNITALFKTARQHPEYNGHESVWDPILNLLNLGRCYQPAISQVLTEGRWENMENPKAYVATAAYRQAFKMGCVGGFRDIKREDIASINRFDGTKSKTAPQEADLENFFYHRCSGGSSFDDDIRERVPSWLLDPLDEIDWKTVATQAALKPEMRKRLERVLRLRFEKGVSRERAVAACVTKEEKQEIEATWKWVDRNLSGRIEPLFRLDQKPSIKGTKSPGFSTFVPAAEAIKRVCARERSTSNAAPRIVMLQHTNNLAKFEILRPHVWKWDVCGKWERCLKPDGTLTDDLSYYRDTLFSGGRYGDFSMRYFNPALPNRPKRRST